MKISVLAVGRLKSGAEQTQFNRYFDLFNAAARGLKMPPMAVIEIGEGRNNSVAERKEAEAQELLKRVGGSRLIVLDEEGKSLTSYEFTAMISRLRDEALDRRFRHRRAGWTRRCGQEGCAPAALSRAHDPAPRSRPHCACRTALPRHDHHPGSPLPPRIGSQNRASPPVVFYIGRLKEISAPFMVRASPCFRTPGSVAYIFK